MQSLVLTPDLTDSTITQPLSGTQSHASSGGVAPESSAVTLTLTSDAPVGQSAEPSGGGGSGDASGGGGGGGGLGLVPLRSSGAANLVVSPSGGIGMFSPPRAMSSPSTKTS